jgi:hypothetical protein
LPHAFCTASVAAQPPPPVAVVTVTAAENAELLPAPSPARTWYRYVVPAARPVSVKDVVTELPTAAKVPPVAPVARQMSYRLTPMLSLDAAHVSVVAEAVVPDAVGVPGVR